MARSRKRTQPHIIVLLADDLGWNEVSWNNKLFLTPNLQVRSDDTAQCENEGEGVVICSVVERFPY